MNRDQAFIGKPYDIVVCGAGSAGSALAGRLAENYDLNVLLLEAGGSDNLDLVSNTDKWPMALGSDLDWGFVTEPNPNLNGRAIPYSMGKVLGGGSSINVGTWSKGHKTDWDRYATESGEPAWRHEAVLNLYRDRVEAWAGSPDPRFYGEHGAMHVEPANADGAFASGLLAGAKAAGLTQFVNSGGELMEADGGVAVVDNIIRDGRRQSVYRSYVQPRSCQSNLTVLINAETTRLLFEGERVVGVEYYSAGHVYQARAVLEVVICQGALQTPKLLMQSGIGDRRKLERLNIEVRRNLPGVGQNLHDHVALGLVWEATNLPLPPEARSAVAAFWKTEAAMASPNCYAYGIGVPFMSEANAAAYSPPSAGWTLLMGLRPQSRGSVDLTGDRRTDPLRIEANYLSDPADLGSVTLGIDRAREIGNSVAMRPFTKREVAASGLKGEGLEQYIRNGLTTFWHQCGTARMGTNDGAVVDGKLKVSGIRGLRIADASILPSVTTGNTMAPCVIVGEQAAKFIMDEHGV